MTMIRDRHALITMSKLRAVQPGPPNSAWIWPHTPHCGRISYSMEYPIPYQKRFIESLDDIELAMHRRCSTQMGVPFTGSIHRFGRRPIRTDVAASWYNCDEPS